LSRGMEREARGRRLSLLASLIGIETSADSHSREGIGFVFLITFFLTLFCAIAQRACA
jgi:hypothetical protein